MTSQVVVANRAFSKLGARPITSVSDSSQEARAVTAAWAILRDSELRAHPWAFSMTRGRIGALTERPAFGFEYQFELPAGYLRLVEIDGAWCWSQRKEVPWQIEGRRLLLNRPGPVNLRWVGVVENVGLWDPLFVDAFSCRLAHELCEQLTGSDSKRVGLERDYMRMIMKAQQTDAIERASVPARDDSWITERSW